MEIQHNTDHEVENIESSNRGNRIPSRLLKFLLRNKYRLVLIYFLIRTLSILPDFMHNMNSGMDFKKSAGYSVASLPDRILPENQSTLTYQLIALLNAIDDCNDLDITCDIPTALEIIFGDESFGQGLTLYSLYNSMADRIVEYSYKDPRNMTSGGIINFNELSESRTFEKGVEKYLIEKVEIETNILFEGKASIDSIRAILIQLIIFNIKSSNFTVIDKSSIDQSIEYALNVYHVDKPVNYIEHYVHRAKIDYTNSDIIYLIQFANSSNNSSLLLYKVPRNIYEVMNKDWETFESSMRNFLLFYNSAKEVWAIPLDKYLSIFMTLEEEGHPQRIISNFTVGLLNLISIGFINENNIDEFLSSDLCVLYLNILKNGEHLSLYFDMSKSLDELNQEAQRYLYFIGLKPDVKASTIIKFMNSLRGSDLTDDEITYFLNDLPPEYIGEVVNLLNQLPQESRETLLIIINQLSSLYGDHATMLFSEKALYLYEQNLRPQLTDISGQLVQDIPEHMRSSLMKTKVWGGEDYREFVKQVVRGNMNQTSEVSFNKLLGDLRDRESYSNKGNEDEMDLLLAIDLYYISNSKFFIENNIPLGRITDDETFSFRDIFWNIYINEKISASAFKKIFESYQYRFGLNNYIFTNGKLNPEGLKLFENISLRMSELTMSDTNPLWGLEDFVYEIENPDELLSLLNTEGISNTNSSRSIYKSIYEIFNTKYSFPEIVEFVNQRSFDAMKIEFIARNSELSLISLEELAEMEQSMDRAVSHLSSFVSSKNPAIRNTIFNVALELALKRFSRKYAFTEFEDIPSSVEIEKGVILIDYGSNDVYLTYDIENVASKLTENPESVITANSIIYNGVGDNELYLTSEGDSNVDFSTITLEHFMLNYAGKSFITKNNDGDVSVLTSDDIVAIWQETSVLTLDQFISANRINLFFSALPEIEMNGNEIYIRQNSTTERFAIQDRIYSIVGNDGKTYSVALMSGVGMTEELFRKICREVNLTGATAFISDLGTSARFYTQFDQFILGSAEFNSAPRFLVYFEK